jgi:TetR/AcrR family transcriptional regulator, tetracycline repressor protein
MRNQLKSKREPLTRERVISTALRIMDEEGLDAVTMRRIGRELGVEAMSLYNHVEDKDDILTGICEHVLAQFRVPEVDDWGEAARLGAREYRRLLRDHPNVITLMTEQKGAFTNPESLRGYEFALDVFHRAGLQGADAVKAFHAFGGYILGFVTMELGLILGGEDEHDAQGHAAMAQLAGMANLPRLREALPHFLECDDDEQFEFGLDLLIEGLRAHAATGSPPSAVSGD